MKRYFSILIAASCLFIIPVSANGLDVWTNIKQGVVASGFQLEFETNREDARVFWTRQPDASPAEGLMFTEPIQIDRTGTIHYFAFTPEPDLEYTEMKKATFFVESETGYEHFRIAEVNPQQKTVTLKNYSRYPVDLSGWKLESLRGEHVFTEQILPANEIITVQLPMRSVSPRVLLRAPNGNAEQVAALPVTRQDSVWRCESRISATCKVVIVE